jgi:hypothetical protein
VSVMRVPLDIGFFPGLSHLQSIGKALPFAICFRK